LAATQTEGHPIDPAIIREIRDAAISKQKWPQSVEQVALKVVGALDAGETGTQRFWKFEITDHGTKALAILHTVGIPDDSVSERYEEIEFRKEKEVWLPVTGRTAIKGRGFTGWKAGLGI
jgi:hypothetical protein